MDSMLNFLSNNYKWFLLAAGILMVALIGFIVDAKKKKKGNNPEVPNVNPNVVQTPPAAPVGQTSTEPATTAIVNMDAPSMEAPTTNMEVPVTEMPTTAETYTAPTMSFSDMPSPTPSDNLANPVVSNENVLDPIQNNTFTEAPTIAPVVETPSFQEMPTEMPTVQMPAFEVPSVETPIQSASAEISQPEMPTIAPVIEPQAVVMPESTPVEQTVISEPTTMIEPTPAIITPEANVVAPEPVGATTDTTQNQ